LSKVFSSIGPADKLYYNICPKTGLKNFKTRFSVRVPKHPKIMKFFSGTYDNLYVKYKSRKSGYGFRVKIFLGGTLNNEPQNYY
jgi:hypothetical protein